MLVLVYQLSELYASNIKDPLLLIECCSALTELYVRNDVPLLWTPSHTDKYTNIRADELAKSIQSLSTLCVHVRRREQKENKSQTKG